MACRREAGTIESRIIQVLQKLSPMDIEEATGKTSDYFYKCANPNNRQSIHLRDSIKLDKKLIEIGQKPEFYNIYQESMQETFIMADPNDCFMSLIKEVGELAIVLKLDAPKSQKIKEAKDVVNEILYLVQAIEGQE